ncbi:MAG: DUF3426 domain-containing protein [Chromatiales bacterium]|nr:DUF3426 domain-containing protein [Chromatiales bacterium]
MAAQLVHEQPALKTAIELACRALPCRHSLVIDMHRLDLVESAVTPHPRYDRALRIQATLVNRAEYVAAVSAARGHAAEQPGPGGGAARLPSRGSICAKSQRGDAGLLPQVAVTIAARHHRARCRRRVGYETSASCRRRYNCIAN